MSCIIQFTRYSCVRFGRLFSSVANWIILSHLVELVKNFFQVFSKLFDVCCAPGFRRSSRNLIIIPHELSFVKNFFQILQISFQLALFNCPRGQLRYITTAISICQALFTKKCIIFCVLLLHPSVRHRRTDSLLPAGKAAADICQRIACLEDCLFLHRQISQADHAAEPSILQHRKPPDLLPAHKSCRRGSIHIRLS